MPDWKPEIRQWLVRANLEPAREAAIIEEFAQYLDDCYAELVANGKPEAEAYRQTLTELQGCESFVRELGQRERQIAPEPIVLGSNRRINMIADLWQDLRYAARMLRRAPGFTAAAVLALALGISVNTTILSVVNAFVLRSLPAERPHELVKLFRENKKKGALWGSIAYANYVDLRDQNETLTGLLALQNTSAGIRGSEDYNSGDSVRTEVAYGELVSVNYFAVLGVKLVLGRGFSPEEERTENTHPVVVLGHAFWQRRFNSDAAIAGKKILINGNPFTVIGVAPATFKGLDYGIRHDFWAPLMMQSKFNGQKGWWVTNRNWNNLQLMGRLKPGVTVAQADADLKRIANNLAQLYPKDNADMNVRVVSEFDGRYRGTTWILRLSSLLALCVAGLVLLAACANVANLTLARATARRKEIGIRLAVGAGRFRIVRQLLTESLLLALLGGTLGWLFAYWGADLVRLAFPLFTVTIDLDLSPGLYVLKWMVGIAFSTVLIFGLPPALLASRPDLVAVLKSEIAGQSGSGRRWNLRGALVVAQVTISFIVLVCAGLFLRSWNNAVNTELGFSTKNLVMMTADLGSLGYTHEMTQRFHSELLKRIEAQPGVRAAALTQRALLEDNSDTRTVVKEGEPDPSPSQGNAINLNVISPGYFETIKTPLMSGRDFSERDQSDAPLVAIVNQEYARKFYGSEENALGKRIRILNSQSPLIEIVGVAKNALYDTLYEAPQPHLFLPRFQHLNYGSGMTLLVSGTTAGDLKALADGVRGEIEQLDSRVPVTGLRLADEILSYDYWAPRLAAGIGTSCGLLALLLATMGLYSVMTYAVGLRMREIGVRLALGARGVDVFSLVIAQGMKLVVVGLVLGLIASLALTRTLKNLLFGVSATDPLTFVAIALLLMLVALLACYVPARRATKVDPMIALRSQ
jgi:putative ABC transport system permease protein